MPMSEWPCIPDDFVSILPRLLPSFLQTGATHAIGRPVSIIDPLNGNRIDPLERYDMFQDLCRYLRSCCKSQNNPYLMDEKCLECDIQISEKLTKLSINKQKFQKSVLRYRCYMGCEEYATLINVGGLEVMVISGQFMPAIGPKDIEISIQCLGERKPRKEEVSPEFWEDIEQYNYPETLWTGSKISESEKEQLIVNAQKLEPANRDFGDKLLEVAGNIEDIAKQFYELARSHLEADIRQKIAHTLSQARVSDKESLWHTVTQALDIIRKGLGVRYAAFYSGDDEQDTILKLRSISGGLPPYIKGDYIYPHFNWRKARLKTEDKRDTHEQIYDCNTIALSESYLLQRGFRTNRKDMFKEASIIIPSRLPTTGPFSILILGPNEHGVLLENYAPFVLSACRDISTRILTLQLADILRYERSEWERTTKLTGHRIRSSILKIGSNLNTLISIANKDPLFRHKNKNEIETDLYKSFKYLEEISYATESRILAIDVLSAERKLYSLYDIITYAIAAQEDLAEENEIEIYIDENIKTLHRVYINKFLIQSVFINLINNGLKYSYPRKEDGKRILKIEKAEKNVKIKEVGVKIVNFGLGIKKEDQDRIFNWHTRIVEASKGFKEIYGEGIGLWECKYVIEGHKGKILVESVHYTKKPVTDENSDQCITVFTVVLPKG